MGQIGQKILDPSILVPWSVIPYKVDETYQGTTHILTLPIQRMNMAPTRMNSVLPIPYSFYLPLTNTLTGYLSSW